MLPLETAVVNFRSCLATARIISPRTYTPPSPHVSRKRGQRRAYVASIGGLVRTWCASYQGRVSRSSSMRTWHGFSGRPPPGGTEGKGLREEKTCEKAREREKAPLSLSEASASSSLDAPRKLTLTGSRHPFCLLCLQLGVIGTRLLWLVCSESPHRCNLGSHDRNSRGDEGWLDLLLMYVATWSCYRPTLLNST